MSINSAFKSTSPEVQEAWAKHRTAMEEQRQAFLAIQEQYGLKILFRNGSFGSDILGLDLTRADEDNLDRAQKTEPPEGFRYDKAKGYFVPALKTAAGKKIRDEWRKLHVAKPQYPGLPDVVMASGTGWQTYMHSPAMFDFQDVVYCGWGCAADYVTGKLDEDGKPKSTDFSKSGFDPEMWETIPLSEFFKAHEDYMAEVASAASV